MNGNATKKQFQFPPLLNLCKDFPHVDTTLSSFEFNNSPFLNGMIQPLYRKKLDSKYIFDHDGNKYKLENGILYRNGTRLFSVEDKHFERRDVTEEVAKYFAFDLVNTNDSIVFSIWNDVENTITFTYGSKSATTGSLFVEGRVIEKRLRVINSTFAHLVVIYEKGGKEYVFYARFNLNTGALLQKTVQLIWSMPFLKLASGATQRWFTLNLQAVDPIIYICEHGFSIVSNYGYAADSRHTGLFTAFFYNDDLRIYNNGILPQYTSSQKTVTTDYSTYFLVKTGNVKSVTRKAVLRDESGIYYKYETEGVVGEKIEIPTSYTTIDGKEIVSIDGKEYSKRFYEEFTYTLYTTVSGESGETFSFTMNVGERSASSGSVTGSKQISVTFTAPAFETVVKNITKVSVTWRNTDFNIPASFWDSTYYNAKTTVKTLGATVSSLNAPNVFLDDGSMIALWTFEQTTSTMSQYAMATGNYIVGTARFGSVGSGGTLYSFSPIDAFTIESYSRVARSNSIACEQGMIVVTAAFSNTDSSAPKNFTETKSENSNARFFEVTYSNNRKLKFFPGTRRSPGYNYYGDSASEYSDKFGKLPDDLVFSPTGFRTKVGNTKWNWLSNLGVSRLFVLAGLSYSEDEDAMGTSVATWNTLDRSFYVVANENRMIYHDDSSRFWEISIKDGALISTAVEDRYVLVNTISFWNMYDSQMLKKFHYATDYNQRLDFGYSSQPTVSQVNTSSFPGLGQNYYLRAVGNGINPLYLVQPRNPVISVLQEQYELYRVGVGQETVYGSESPEDVDVQPIDVFYSEISETGSVFDNFYRYSIYSFTGTSEKIARQNTLWFTYGTTVKSTIKPLNIFSKVIVGAGNNDAVQEGNAYFTLLYYDNKPLLAYNNDSANGYDVIDAFFVIQGQFYSIINDKLYSMTYSGGQIQTREAIVDIAGMTFIGNNPMIAFFWSESQRAFYSFTGDANLSFLFSGSKFTQVGTNDKTERKYFYDESSQSIFVPTDYGLLVFGPNNTYILSEFKNTSNVQFSKDGITHITDGDYTYDQVYYSKDGFEVIPIELETSFYGNGSNDVSTIDRYDVILYDQDELNEKVQVKAKVASITDVAINGQDVEKSFTKNDYDKTSNSILWKITPELQKGRGIKLKIVSPLTIQSVTAHISSMGTGVLTKFNS